MQQGDESTPRGAEKPGSVQPGDEPEQGRPEHEESDHPEKVYDFVHQHFGVALKSGGQESRQAEQAGRNYGAGTEVADKPLDPHDVKSDSWHALKNLIRYQTSTTEAERSYPTTGSAFEAQWFSENKRTSAPADTSDGSPENVRLKWIPIVDNVPETAEINDPGKLETAQINDHGKSETAEINDHVKPVIEDNENTENPLALLDEFEDLLEPVIEEQQDQDEKEPEYSDDILLDFELPSQSDEHEEHTENVFDEKSVEVQQANPPYLKEEDPMSDQEHQITNETDFQHEDDEAATASYAAEARSKFGSLNAFERLQKRTKEQSQTKEEQSTTGDIPDSVPPENWDAKKESDTEGATIMSQWCSASTGDNIPSLSELDSIPTPTVMQNPSPAPKPFSLHTPKPSTSAEDETEHSAPDLVRHTARSSWLQAASEYSASVIKAVTEQMKSLNAKPKKVTPESPEFTTAELPEHSEQSDDISST